MSEERDYFRDRPFERWTGVAGAWAVADHVEADQLDRRVLYRSPEEPSHVAWVGIWQAADGSIGIRFPQLTGNVGLEPSYAPWYGRVDFAEYEVESWEAFAAKHSMITGPAEALATTRLDYITMVTRDGGDTWDTVSTVRSDTVNWSSEATRGYNGRLVLAADGSLVGKGMATLRCRDGRIVDTHAFDEWTDAHAGGRYLLGLRESADQGRTWTPLRWLTGTFADGRPVTQATEEHDLIELADGRLLGIIRADGILHPLAAWLRRTADGSFQCEAVEIVTSMPHAGKPAMVRTDDGTIWYWGARHFYSVDEGRTWRGLPDSQAFAAYYGKMLATGSQVLCVTQRDIGDSPYPVQHDACIEQIRFAGRRIGVVRQTAPLPGLAVLMRRDRVLADLHLRLDVRPDHADGVAFRLSPDGRSGYAFVILLPASSAATRWQAPPVQGATLSAYFPGLLDEHVRERIEQGLITVRPRPTAVLARVDQGRIQVLRGLRLCELPAGAWLQLQVKAHGEVIQAAVSDGSTPPTYLGVRDATYTEGAIGLLTDGGSLGAFKNLSLWPGPRLIRELWTGTAGQGPVVATQPLD